MTLLVRCTCAKMCYLSCFKIEEKVKDKKKKLVTKHMIILRILFMQFDACG